MNEYPVDSKEAVSFMTALASGSKASADKVLDLLTDKETYAEPVEHIGSHMIDVKGSTFVNLKPRHKGNVFPLNQSTHNFQNSANKTI